MGRQRRRLGNLVVNDTSLLLEQTMTRAVYRTPTDLELHEATRLQSYFPYRIVWGYLDGQGEGFWVWMTSATRHSMNAKARAGYAVVVA
jgi:hypothetical protein